MSNGSYIGNLSIREWGQVAIFRGKISAYRLMRGKIDLIEFIEHMEMKGYECFPEKDKNGNASFSIHKKGLTPLECGKKVAWCHLPIESFYSKRKGKHLCNHARQCYAAGNGQCWIGGQTIKYYNWN